MGFLDRAGNLVKGFLKKPLEALEKSPEEKLLERELEDKAAVERARKNIEDLDRQAGPVPAEKPKPAAAGKPAEPAKDDSKDDGRKKRRMGPD
jgi:hypothetical protein